jgi:hypothetical protein
VLANTALGNHDAAAKHLATLEQADNNDETLASAYAWLGRHDDALSVLERAIDPPRTFGPRPLAGSPLFPGLSSHPRWQAILEKQGTSEARLEELNLDNLFPGAGKAPLVEVAIP